MRRRDGMRFPRGWVDENVSWRGMRQQGGGCHPHCGWLLAAARLHHNPARREAGMKKQPLAGASGWGGLRSRVVRQTDGRRRALTRRCAPPSPASARGGEGADVPLGSLSRVRERVAPKGAGWGPIAGPLSLSGGRRPLRAVPRLSGRACGRRLPSRGS